MTQDYDHEEYLEGDEIEIEAIGIDVDAHPIELYKLFKIANLVSGGGEAKHIIEEGYVAVNGELETRKRRKMYDGDFLSLTKNTMWLFVTRQLQNQKRQNKKRKRKRRKKRNLLVKRSLAKVSRLKRKAQDLNQRVVKRHIKSAKHKKKR